MKIYEIRSMSSIRWIAPRLFQESYDIKYRRPLRKAGFFIWREGLRATIRKYRSKRLERKIEAGLSMALVRLDLDDKSIIAFARGLGSTLLAERELIFEVAGRCDLSSITLDAHCLELFESYLPVSECPLAPTLADAVQVANPALVVAPRTVLEQAIQVGVIVRQENVEKKTAVVGCPTTPGLAPIADTGVFFMGFGGYVREYVLPHFRPRVVAACDYRADLISKYCKVPIPVLAEQNSFLGLIARQRRPLVIIASYHSTHAIQAKLVLDANPEARVFIEKPLGITIDDVRLVAGLRETGHWVDIGYNRRYAPLTQAALSKVRNEDGLFSMSASVKELSLPASHWYLWPNQGSRLRGNVVHWLDLAVLFADCEPTRITAVGTPDRASIAILFESGATASLTASDDGDDLRGVQEHFEVRTPSSTIRIRDYTSIEVIADGVLRRRYVRLRRKGHHEMYRSLRERWLNSRDPLYPVRDMFRLQEIVDECHRQLSSDPPPHPVTMVGAQIRQEPPCER